MEFVAVFAEAAKQRQIEGGRAGAELTNSTSARVGENLPQPAEGERGPRATDEAAELFGVSGRSVRDAQYVKNNDPDIFEKVKAGDVAVVGVWRPPTPRAAMPLKRPRMPVHGLTGGGWVLARVEPLATYVGGRCGTGFTRRK